ncbi:MAG: outer membrane protein transport protein [Opitutaceae bacterium]|nr:outer membrane protein transport protein [Opitutaceae bacterium]
MHLVAMRHARRGLRPLALAVSLALLAPAAALAGGMALTTQNGSQLGNGYSGAAAAEDASTVYFNPAGLAFLDQGGVVVSGQWVKFDTAFTNTGSTTAGVIPTPGRNSGDAGEDRLVPTAYMAYPFSKSFAIGAGVSAPYGLATEYPSDWVGRYQALKSELVTINATIAASIRLTPQLALGLGLDHQTADAELSNALDLGLAGYVAGVPGFAPGSADAVVRIKGDDARTGFNIGVLYEITDGTRVGLHYRSRMEHEPRGDARFTDVAAPFAGVFTDQAVSAPLALPEVYSLSFMHHVAPDLALFADWSVWAWSCFDQLAVDFENPATPDFVQIHDWKNASIYSLGARWQKSERLTLRGGLVYNETPVPNESRRTARIPDSDRTWVCLGAAWQFNAEIRGEIGYAHLFFKDATMANDDGAGHLLVGRVESSADILSMQVNWNY